MGTYISTYFTYEIEVITENPKIAVKKLQDFLNKEFDFPENLYTHIGGTELKQSYSPRTYIVHTFRLSLSLLKEELLPLLTEYMAFIDDEDQDKDKIIEQLSAQLPETWDTFFKDDDKEFTDFLAYDTKVIRTRDVKFDESKIDIVINGLRLTYEGKVVVESIEQHLRMFEKAIHQMFKKYELAKAISVDLV